MKPGEKLKIILMLSTLFLFSTKLHICFAQNSNTSKNDYLVAQDTKLSDYQVIEQRNFFRPKIEPGQPVPDTLSESEPALQLPVQNNTIDLVLTGVIEIKNGYKAIVEKISQKKGFYVSMNDAIGDYTVKKIYLNRIILEKNGETFELKLKQGNAQQTAPAPTQTQTQAQDTPPPDTAKIQQINTMQKLRMGIGGKR